MKKLLTLVLLSFACLTGFPQETFLKQLEDGIADRIREKQRDSLFCDFLDSMPDLQAKRGRLIPFNIYELGTRWSSVVSMNDNIIDTAKFTKEYFLSGNFVKDFLDVVHLNDASDDASINFGRLYAYDTLEHKTYRFSGWFYRFEMDTWNINRGKAITRESSQYLSCRSSCPFEDYIGYLLYKDLVDVVFYFPTYMDYEEGIVCTLIEDVCFAIKDENLFVISENWTQNHGDNHLLLYSIGDYLDCCWEKMTNIYNKPTEQAPCTTP